MLEKTVEEILKRHVARIWPDLKLQFVGSQRRLRGGNIYDLCFSDPDSVHWIVELKRNRISASTVLQLVRYLNELRIAEGENRFCGIVAGFSISDSALIAAEKHGIVCRKLDESTFRNIATEFGLKLDHESRARPKRSGSNRSASRPIVRKSRPAASVEIVEFLRSLDRQFPPGSLTHLVDLKTLGCYWRAACPDASAQHQEIAALLSHEVLRLAPTTAIARRSQSKNDPYTTICALDGRVAAAIDARANYIKLDFPLPFESAKKQEFGGSVRIWNARGYSYWVQSRVASVKGLSVEHAIELLREGLLFEFQNIAPE